MRWFQAISGRMTGIFLLLILAAMMLISSFLWFNLERYYHLQHAESMLRSVQAYEQPAVQYLLQKQEIVALQAEMDAQEAASQSLLDSELEKCEETLSIYKKTLIDLTNLSRAANQTEAAGYFQVAVVDRAEEAIVKSPGVSYFDGIGLSLLRAAILSGTTQVDPYQTADNRLIRIIAYPLKSGDNTLGLIYIEAEDAGLDANMAMLRNLLFGATLAALIFTLVISVFLANSITAPITKLTRRAQSLAQGDYTTLIEVGSQDEVGHLAEAFNILTVRLRETMEEIGDEKGKMEAMLNYMAEGVIAVDDQGLAIHINPSARRMFALSDERSGLPLGEILGNLEQELGWRRALLREEMVTCELALPQELGGLMLRAHSAPFFTAGEDVPSGVVVVLTDTSEEERLEETRRDFIANVSHELRTPLTTVKSYVETLLDGALHTEELAQRFLNVVLQETDRMSRLVSELLTMAQLDAPSRPESLHIQDLKLIVQSVERKMTPQFEAKKQNFILELCTDPAYILAPQDRIEQLCVNLLSNACKYTAEAGQISLSLIAGVTGNEIIIRDNGIGIAAEHLPRLFERFYRVDKARSRELGGTGLGLAIAKQIVEKLGGSIHIDSEVGQGTQVTIWLPKPEQYAVWGGEYHA